MRNNVIVLLFTFNILLCSEGTGVQLYAQVSSTQTLRLTSQIGLGYEIISAAGLYMENFLIYDTVLNDYQKICIMQYRIKRNMVSYEFVLDEIIDDIQRQSPIVVQQFWDGGARVKRYNKRKLHNPIVPINNSPFELTCISENPYKQEHYMFSIKEVPHGLPIEICNYLWQRLSLCTMHKLKTKIK